MFSRDALPRTLTCPSCLPVMSIASSVLHGRRRVLIDGGERVLERGRAQRGLPTWLLFTINNAGAAPNALGLES